MSNHKWTPAQLEYIRANAGKMKDKDIAAELSRLSARTISLQSIRKQRQFLGLKKAQGRGVCSLIVDSGQTPSIVPTEPSSGGNNGGQPTQNV